MELEDLISKLKQAFSKQEIKKAVLDQEWYSKNIETKIDSTGFCYAACEIIYRMTGGKERWKKYAISKDKWNDGGHCYLMDKKDNSILDITSDQYLLNGIDIPYHLGVAGGFRTKDFTKKARLLAEMANILS